jgi:hypothetical protein
MDSSRVLKQLNRSDASAERDVAALRKRDVKYEVRWLLRSARAVMSHYRSV